MDDIKALYEMYKIVTMGIIGIDEVKGHIEDKTLTKTMSDARKKYMVNKMDITNMLKDINEEPEEINIIIKMFNEIYTGIELIKCDDAKIAKMLTEGTNKGIIKVEEILNSNVNEKVKTEAEELLDLLEFQIKSWKSYL
ncbi:putative uncharacterized protein [Clostridium sp. CAG:609]|jgi:hypothetical protein|nr:putative uncharacterized protein [Clostridium sp. CAG:609]